MFDMIVENGMVVDGTGNQWYRADVGISEGRIAALGNLEAAEACERVDATNRVVCPGFVDTHTHSDLVVLARPAMEFKLRQGVTTELLGQDGLSVAPVTDATRPAFKRRLAGLLGTYRVDWNWESVDDYLTRLDRARSGTNLMYLVPHGAVRAQVLGFGDRPPDGDELATMKGLVAQAMEQGAVGLSTGLIYPPCSYASTDELVELCRVVSSYGGVFVVHMRNEGDFVLEAAGEVVDVARRSGVALHISHLKVAGSSNRHKTSQLLATIDGAREQGIDVSFDQYPYEAGSTLLDSLLPPWVHEGGVDRLLGRLRNPETRRQIARELLETPSRENPWDNWVSSCGWENIVVTAVTQDQNRRFEGKNLLEIAALVNSDPADALFDLLVDEQSAVTMAAFWGDDQVVADIMRHPGQMVCSDGILGGKPHPRVYGAFPRVLGKYVREDRVLTLPEAVARMTSHAAQRFGLRDRGLLKVGFCADIVVLDADAVVDRATYTQPHQYPEGITDVLVNGKPAVRNSMATGERAGRVLRGNGRGLTG